MSHQTPFVDNLVWSETSSGRCRIDAGGGDTTYICAHVYIQYTCANVYRMGEGWEQGYILCVRNGAYTHIHSAPPGIYPTLLHVMLPIFPCVHVNGEGPRTRLCLPNLALLLPNNPTLSQVSYQLKC